VIEKAEAKPDDEIEVYVPSEWPSDAPPARVRYADFWSKQVNPNITNPLSAWGDYLLPLLHPGDVPILQKLFPDQVNNTRLGDMVQWTYGIQRGGVELTPEPTGLKPIKVIGGRSLAVAWPGQPLGWVDLDAVEKRPNGKLSLWRGTQSTGPFIAVATLGRMPFAAVVDMKDIAAINSTIVSHSRVGMDIDLHSVAAYLNSKLAQFYWVIKLRTAVLEGSSRATLYPRTLESLPWPKNLLPEQGQQLTDGYARLATLAERAKDNPNEWLLAESERRIVQGTLRLTEPSLGLQFPSGTVEARPGELTFEGRQILNGLLPFAEFADADLAEYVFRLLLLTSDEETPLGAATVQRLLVPGDYQALMLEYRQRWADFQRVEQDFFVAMKVVDEAVYTMFGLTAEERVYVETRLSTFPLNRLRPRYPWDVVRSRTVKTYTQDRFA
jgi:hypothetical protein